MRIGILADSHGKVDITRRAVHRLQQCNVDLMIHLGDFETEAVIDELAGHQARIVFGNCDYDIRELKRYAEFLNIKVDHPMGRLQVNGKRIAFTHGHTEQLMVDALEEEVDYLLHGHSHELRDDRIGKTRIINPGALSRASRYTVAVLNPDQDDLEIIEIPKDDAT